MLRHAQRSTGLSEAKTRGLLGQFLFSGDDVKSSYSQLSGGESQRLSLAILVSSTRTCSSSTSRPTTSTSRAARHSRTRWPDSPARSCSSRTTGRCSRRSAPAPSPSRTKSSASSSEAGRNTANARPKQAERERERVGRLGGTRRQEPGVRRPSARQRGAAGPRPGSRRRCGRPQARERDRGGRDRRSQARGGACRPRRMVGRADRGEVHPPPRRGEGEGQGADRALGSAQLVTCADQQR